MMPVPGKSPSFSFSLPAAASAVGVSAKWVFDSGLWQRESADQKCQFGTGLCSVGQSEKAAEEERKE